MAEQAPRLRWSRKKRVLVWGGSVLAILLAAAGVLYRLAMPGLRFLQRIADSSPQALDAGGPLRVTEARVRCGERDVPLRVYQPAGEHERAVVLVHGLHYGGYDEERLVPFARKLAGMGFAVVTPDLVDLKEYAISPRSVDEIERVALWTLDESGLGSGDDGRIGMMGICFAGGLGLAAAGRPSLRDRMAFAFAFGAHADLDRTMDYLCTGRLPDGKELKPHPYSQAAILSQTADRLVPPEEAKAFREAALEYLHGKDAEARAHVGLLGPRAKELLTRCMDGDTLWVGAQLAPAILGTPSPDALSPARGAPPNCTVYVLHGSVDNVVPPSESRRLAEWASSGGGAVVLISDLVSHVELEQGKETRWGDTWDLARFWTRLLRS